MTRSIIVYFSQMGSTAKVAGAIAEGIRNSGYEVDSYNLKDSKPPDINGYDLLGIGAPVYNYTQPINVLDYVHSLANINKLPVFAFNTFGTYRFDAGNYLIQPLINHGAKFIGYFSCRGADLYLGYLKQGFFASPDFPKVQDLAEAESFGFEVVARTKGKPYALLFEKKSAPVIYRFERFVFNRWLTQHIYSHFFNVNEKVCNNCGVCIKTCPNQNIIKNNSGYPTWGNNCIGCFMCEMRCPNDAISSVIDWPILRPFFKYNVRTAFQDKLIEHVRVKHQHGKTQRL
jgi:flavodoxin/Pyruvate/2-oxoacid:ferredoxin oxidoreductase delta subunit